MRRELGVGTGGLVALLVGFFCTWCWVGDVSQNVFKHFSKALGKEKQFLSIPV